jgi:thiamine-monophosphate kinase
MTNGPLLQDLGEDAVVRAITRDLPGAPDVQVGAGDDCAVVGPPKARTWTLLKTDVVIEGVHFESDTEPRRVGWKALCRAISDVAAMGGTPKHALVTLALSPGTSLAWVEELYAGLQAAAERYGATIVGGETARSPAGAFINVALTGEVPRKHCILRSGGSPGDLLYVTGRLGGSRSGKHLDFEPRLAEGQHLAESVRPSAMMDLSDGLAKDLPRLAQASECSFSVELERIPKTPGTSLEQALGDGEDFELLFAVPPRRARLLATWEERFPGTPLTQIGVLASPTTSNTELRADGHDHFH